MTKKYRILQAANIHAPAVKDQRYSYYANVGTFWVHRWIRSGADRAKIAQVDKARAYIAKALAINPNAHFGREKYQLEVMDWISYGGGESLYDYLRATEPDIDWLNFKASQSAITGLSGLVVLGGAWESVDIFDTLAHLLGKDRYNYTMRLAYMAQFRRDELIDAGGRSLAPGAPTGADLKTQLALGNVPPPNADDYRNYKMLRTEADRWQQARTAFMIARLQSGRHPDTDPTFWSGYHDQPPPALHNPWDEAIYVAIGKPLNIDYLFFWFLMIVFLIAGAMAARRVHRKFSR